MYDFKNELKTESKHCLNCKHSYINSDTGFGYCKHEKNCSGMVPKAIEEMETCRLWVTKLEPERNKVTRKKNNKGTT